MTELIEQGGKHELITGASVPMGDVPVVEVDRRTSTGELTAAAKQNAIKRAEVMASAARLLTEIRTAESARAMQTEAARPDPEDIIRTTDIPGFN